MRIAFCPFCGNAASSGDRCSRCGQVVPGLRAPAEPPQQHVPKPQVDFGRTVSTGTNMSLAQSIAALDVQLKTLAEPPQQHVPTGPQPAVPAPAVAPPLGRPRVVERVENLGVGPVLGVASLLARKDQQPAAIRLLERAAERFRDVQDTARIRLALASYKAGLGQLTEADLSAVSASALRLESERATLAQLYRMIAAAAREAKPADAKRAAMRALSIGGAALVGELSADPKTRLGVAFAAGIVDEAADLALAQWRTNPASAESLQVAASAFLRRAVALEEKPEIGLDARRNAWERAIGTWAMICAPSTTFWNVFASARGAIYQKEVGPDMIFEAKNGAKDRVAKVLRDLEARHRDAGRTAERAQIGRFVQLFAAEIEAAEKMWGLVASLPSAQQPPVRLFYPCGPLGLDVLGRREDAVFWLANLDLRSQDPRVKELLDGMGTLAEGWALLRDGKLGDAAAYAQARRRAAPGDREAARLLDQAAKKNIEKCLVDEDIDGAVNSLDLFAPKDVPEELVPMVQAIGERLVARDEIKRARDMIQRIAAGQPGQPKWRDCEAAVLVRLAILRANGEDFVAGINLLLEAQKLAPSHEAVLANLTELSSALAAITIKNSGADAAVRLMEGLGAEQNPRMSLSLVISLNNRGVAALEAKRVEPGIADFERALRIIKNMSADTEEKRTVRSSARKNLGFACMVKAMSTLESISANEHYITRNRRRDDVVELARRAVVLGNAEGRQILEAANAVLIPSYWQYEFRD